MFYSQRIWIGYTIELAESVCAELQRCGHVWSFRWEYFVVEILKESDQWSDVFVRALCIKVVVLNVVANARKLDSSLKDGYLKL